DATLTFKTATALVCRDRKREQARLTFTAFRAEAMAMARLFESHGVGPGSRVALIMGNQPRWLVAAAAAFWRGAVLVPLDYKLTGAEHDALLAHARPDALIVDYPYFRRLSAATREATRVFVNEAPAGAADLGGAEALGELGHADPDAPELEVVPRRREDDATIVYSSGTGGRPKGCVLSHGAYLAQLEGLVALFPLTEGDRYFSILPTNHAIDFMCGFVGPFSGGATVVHQRTLRPEHLLDTMKAERVTHMAVVPLLLEAFERGVDERIAESKPWQREAVKALSALNGWLTAKTPRHALSKRLLRPIHDGFGGDLKVLFCGGAFTERRLAERFYELGLPVVIGYGLTECCTVATVNDLKPFRGDTVGRAVPGVDVTIADPDALGVGEVIVRGPTLMSRYLDDPELTAETLTADGALRTGDLGWLDAAGHLHLVGRRKNMIVTTGGKNVYPEDIEAAFAKVPCEELVVVAADYLWPRKGGGLTGEALVAVVRTTDGDLDATRVAVQQANARLADFKRVSGLVHWHKEFPRTASMKVKRAELADLVRAGSSRDAIVPVGSGETAAASYTSPTGGVA
ncbi:MAG: AMP-binding protein, partial [Myxococcales bacterium]|nr:AMP-binding protein [Myxococcales bacterium]